MAREVLECTQILSSVKLACDAETGLRLAVKYIRISMAKDTLQREITIHKTLCHQNIVQLFDSHESNGYVMMFMELAACGELFDRIEPDVGLSETVSHFFFRQLANAVNYIHSFGITHRDLKPENLLLDENGNLKLSDFGFAGVYKKNGEQRTLNTVCGSPPYIAPEIYHGKYDGELCDVWSMGIILYVLNTGSALWDSPQPSCLEFKSFVQHRQANKTPKWRLNGQISDFLLLILEIPQRRLRLKKLMEHEWLIRDNELYGEDGLCKNVELLASQLDFYPESNAKHFTNSTLSQIEPQELPPCHAISSFSQPIAAFSSIKTMILSQQIHNKKVLPVFPTKITHYFTKLQSTMILGLLLSALKSLGAKTPAQNGNNFCFTLVDRFRCPMNGVVKITELNDNLKLVAFVRQKGDPLEFKRLFRVIIECPEIAKTIVSNKI